MNFLSFCSHLELARFYWKTILQPNGWAIDATCGNGKDTLQLASLPLSGVIGIDKQPAAIKRTSSFLKKNLSEEQYKKIHLFCTSHVDFPPIAYKHPIHLIVYNLGYLPGSNKQITTTAEDTLKSITAALKLITPEGLITICCYPGHAEGVREQTLLLARAQELPPSQYAICHHTWPNKHLPPSLLLIQKKDSY